MDTFTGTYRDATAKAYGHHLRHLFRTTRTTPATLTADRFTAWATNDELANNSIRTRITVVTSFYAWLTHHGYEHCNPTDPLTVRKLRRRYPKTYGRAQAANPGRWLTHSEAFSQLATACHDGSDLGHRDELVIRLGLSGLRVAEIAALTFGARSGTTLRWTGKGRRPASITLNPRMVELWTAMAALHKRTMRTAPGPDTPLIPMIRDYPPGSNARAEGRQSIMWRHLRTMTLYSVVRRRAEAAGLGHVAPHDLRRTAAGILHNATTADGAHVFDLLDIQKVLHHADPVTTMRSYLEPMDTDVLDRAADYLS